MCSIIAAAKAHRYTEDVYGIRKPVYRFFEALSQAGAKRLEVTGDVHRTAEVLALDGEDALMIFAYNHDIEERNIKAEEMEITVNGVFTKITKAVIDSGHCKPLSVWEAQVLAFTAEAESVTIFRLEKQL